MPEKFQPLFPMDADDSKLGRLLKNCESDHIEDAGFTACVMAALPRERHSAGANRRSLLLIFSSLLSVLLILLIGGNAFLAGLSALIELAINGPVLALPGASLGVLPLACLVAGLSLAAALGYQHLRQAFR
jgi:hypothetical protein